MGAAWALRETKPIKADPMHTAINTKQAFFILETSSFL
jgi:hypothetical protein